MYKEIEKGRCVVRCANCHSVKTWAEKNDIEYKPDTARSLESLLTRALVMCPECCHVIGHAEKCGQQQ